MTSIIADIRHIIRICRQVPLESGIAIVGLATAMTFFGALLSLYSSLGTAKHESFVNGQRLVTIGQTDGREFYPLGAGLLERIEADIRATDIVVGVSRSNATAASEQVSIEFVTSRYFDGLRPHLHRGRGFLESDHSVDAEPVAVISYRYWLHALDGSPSAIGSTIDIGGGMENDRADYRIVGVMGPDIGSTFLEPVDLWLPSEPSYPRFYAASPLQSAIARLSEGASVRSLRKELDALYLEGRRDLGFDLRPGYRIGVAPGIVNNVAIQDAAAKQVETLLAGSVLLALVAGGNAGLFLLSQQPKRKRELSVRLAVGAPVRRLARQLVIESAALVLVASVVGMIGGLWLDASLQELPFFRQTQWNDSLLSWRVLGGASALSLVLVVSISISTLLALRKLTIPQSERLVTARASLSQRTFGAFQVAIACLFCSAAFAFLWNLIVLSKDLGYDPDGMFVITQAPSRLAGFRILSSEEDLVRRERWRELLIAQPGIEEVAFGSAWPGLSPSLSMLPHPLDSRTTLGFEYVKIDSEFTELLGIPVVHGRALTSDDRTSVLVNESFANAVWGRLNVVGENARFSALTGTAEFSQIVGVLKDVSFDHPANKAAPTVFFPYIRLRESIILRTTMSVEAIRSVLDRLIDDGALEMDLRDVLSVEDTVNSIVAVDHARSTSITVAAVLVMALAGFGVYATQRYLVSAGRREYAVRAAIGAGPKALARLVCVRGLAIELPGLVVGFPLSIVAVHYLRDRYLHFSVPVNMASLIALGVVALLLVVASVGPLRLAQSTASRLLSDND